MTENENWRETARLTSLHSIIIDVFVKCSFPSLACVASVQKGREVGRDILREERGRREEGNTCKQAIVFAIPPTN